MLVDVLLNHLEALESLLLVVLDELDDILLGDGPLHEVLVERPVLLHLHDSDLRHLLGVHLEVVEQDLPLLVLRIRHAEKDLVLQVLCCLLEVLHHLPHLLILAIAVSRALLSFAC